MVVTLPVHDDGKKVFSSPAYSDDDFDDGLDPQHALMMNPVSAKKMVMLLQEAYPARPKVQRFWTFFGHF